MKKILFFNLDVGSGVEYCGNVFVSWLKERDDIELVEYKSQDHWAHIIKDVIKIKPDVIVLNDSIDSSVHCAFAYKLFNPEVKVIILLHSWKALIPSNNLSIVKDDEKNHIVLCSNFYEICDIIFTMNCMPHNRLSSFKHIINVYFPVDNNKYKINTKWEDRKKNFLYIGSISSLKFSSAFIDALSKTSLSIDCYGSITVQSSKEYSDKFQSCKNIKYKGIIPQDDVPDLLNKYKYFVLPHDGYELFNISLLQSALCGTIPLVLNDRTTTEYDSSWIDWANGLYFGCEKVDVFINNLEEVFFNGLEEGNTTSELISNRAASKYSYNKLKEIFFYILDDLWKEGE